MLRYFVSKVRRAWTDGTLVDKGKRFLATLVRRPFEVLIGYARLARPDRDLGIREGFADHRQKADHHRSDPNHVRRIIAAYHAAKKIQGLANAPFQIRGLWAEWIAINFKPLIAAMEARDTPGLSRLLENLFREQFTTGLGGFDAFVRYRSFLGVPYLKYVWSTYRDKLLDLDLDLRKIGFPLVGNPAGVPMNGSIVSFETLRHAYHAAEMTQLVRDLPDARIVEIGGGLGGQAYQTLHLSGRADVSYVIFDIPEVAALSSYFLLSAFPGRQIVLFGEQAPPPPRPIGQHCGVAAF